VPTLHAITKKKTAFDHKIEGRLFSEFRLDLSRN
jgi:hypothetical protein